MRMSLARPGACMVLKKSVLPDRPPVAGALGVAAGPSTRAPHSPQNLWAPMTMLPHEGQARMPTGAGSGAAAAGAAAAAGLGRAVSTGAWAGGALAGARAAACRGAMPRVSPHREQTVALNALSVSHT